MINWEDAYKEDGVELTMLRESIGRLIAVNELRIHNPRLTMEYQAEMLCHHIGLHYRMPAEVLQSKEVIAEWPTTWWDAVKKRLGLAHNTSQVRLHEAIIYDKLKLKIPEQSHQLRINVTQTKSQWPQETDNASK